MNNNIVDKVAYALDMVSSDIECVYDTITNEIICLMQYDITAAEREAYEEERYLYLPTQYDIDEY